MRNTYFDEKIDGTVHIALGVGFADLGGTNESAIHWDMVKDLRPRRPDRGRRPGRAGERRVGDVIHLRPLTDANRDAVLSLRVSPAQEQFVSGVEESLAEAAEEPGGRAIFWAVYDGETPVGFVM